MRVLLVDPYYLAGHSPPSWVLGQLETVLTGRGHAVSISDFCTARAFATLDEFAAAEQSFVRTTAELAGRADAVYITTSFGVPQKPTPILSRVRALAAAIAQREPRLPVIVGGAQIEYLLSHGLAPEALFSLVRAAEFLRDDLLLPASIGRLCGERDTSAEPKRIEHCTWSAWDLSKYPPYRAILTSAGCRYGCSFCFESRQQFRAFDLTRTIEPYLGGCPAAMAIEDSTIVGAHGTGTLLAAMSALEAEIEFTCYALVAEIDRMEPESLRRLRERGMMSVILGIESPDSETLRLYRKSVRPDRVRRVLAKLHDAGISAQGCFMLGIPEVSLDDTMYTLEYALDLEVDVRRWHIFQPSYERQPERLATPRPLSLEQFAMISVNMPDNLLPLAFDGADQEAFIEEHFLMRAIPYVEDMPERLADFRYASGYTLKTLYERILSMLRGTKTSFNEEDYYRVLTRDHAMFPAVIDRDAGRFFPA